MDTRDMWENQVELLTRHCQSLTRQVDDLQARLQYFEGVIVTLLVALKEGGVIVSSEDGEHSLEQLKSSA